MDRVPGNSFDSSDGGLIHALDTEGGDFIEPGPTVLESIVGSPVCRAKRLPASPAPIATTLPPSGRVDGVANDGSDVTFFPRQDGAGWDS